MKKQFQSPLPFAPEELPDGRHIPGSGPGPLDPFFDTTRVDLDAYPDAQAPTQDGRKNQPDARRPLRVILDALDRYVLLFTFSPNVAVAAWTYARKRAGYAILYALTILSLYGAWATPHVAAWKTPILLIASLILTIFSSPATIKMLAFLVIAPWHELMQALRSPSVASQLPKTRAQPLVSVLIPAWNEEVGLVATIKTILASSYRFIEIVVVNDGSTDQSDAVMQQFLQKYAWSMRHTPKATPILYEYQQNAGKAAALNHAIALSHGEIVISIDADCVMDKDCIAAFVEAMQDPTVMAACGNVKVGNPDHVLSHVQLMEYAASFYARQADALLGTLYVISGAAGAFRRSLFDVVGTYGTALRGGGEDVDLSIRIQRAGMKIAYCPGAMVYTEVPTTLQGLIKQRKRWTFSRFVTFRTYRDMIFSTKREQNKILTWLVIPLIILNDWLYILKMLLKIGLYIVAIATGTYQVLAMMILLTMVIAALPLLKDREYRIYVLLTPIAWILTLIPACIEIYAVASAISNLFRNREVVWQSWQRKGALGSIKK